MKKRIGWIVFCYISSLFFLLFQGGKLASMLFMIATILGIYLLLSRFNGIHQARGTRTIANAQQKTFDYGTTLSVTLRLRFPGFWPVLYVSIRDHLRKQNKTYQTFDFSLVPNSFLPKWKKEGEVTYETPSLTRGRYHFGKTVCSTGDIFSFFEHQGTIHLEDTFRVLPQTVHIPNWNWFDQIHNGTLFYYNTSGALRETTQIDGIREYVYGDRLSQVHWKATAKTGSWKSIDYVKESQSQTFIVLDQQKDAYPSEEAFERAVSAAASLIEYGGQNHRPFGMLCTGPSPVLFEPGKKHHHSQRMLYHLAEVHADGSHHVADVLKQYPNLISPGNSVVIVSPRQDQKLSSAVHHFIHRQMIPCQLRIEDGEETHRHPRSIRNQGTVYTVRDLHELPFILGGQEK